MCEIFSKLTIKIPEWHHWRFSGVFIVTIKQILHIVLEFPLLTLNKKMPAVLERYMKLSCYLIWKTKLSCSSGKDLPLKRGVLKLSEQYV